MRTGSGKGAAAIDQAYTVMEGDSWHRIARRFKTGVRELRAANPRLSEAAYVRPRERLRIPASRADAPGGADGRIVQTRWEYGHRELMDDLPHLRQRYPFLDVEAIGASVMQREIPAIRIGSGPFRVHYNGSFHANEWITSLLLMRFAEDCADALANGRAIRGADAARLFARASLWIVPMVNPDGVELVLTGNHPQHPYYEALHEWNGRSADFTGWKANIRGVDLNDQFPAHWEEEKARRQRSGPGPRDYAGAGPLTEPEAAALAAFTRRMAFDCVVALHTQGEEIYWNYRDCEPASSAVLAERFAAASGYRAVRLDGSDAGYKDWFVQEFRRPGFTVEAGLGTNPLPLSRFADMYQDLLGLLLEGLRAPRD